MKICDHFSVPWPKSYTSLYRFGPINSSTLACIRAQIEKGAAKEKGSSREKGTYSQHSSPRFGGVNVDLNEEIEHMVEEGAPPPFGVSDIQDIFEELSLQVAFGFSQIDS